MPDWRRVLFTATLGQSVGRVATLLTPLLILSVHPADAQADRFFLLLAVSFYFSGSIANALTEAGVPLYAQSRYSPKTLSCGVVAVLLAVLFYGGWQWYSPQPDIRYGIAGALIVGSGIAAAFPTAALFVAGNYLVSGVTWLMRLVPLLLFIMLADQSEHALVWLALGFGVADLGRYGLIALAASKKLERGAASESPPKVLHHYMAVIAGVLISGLNPLVDRFIAGLGPVGAISVLDLGERVYQVFGALASVGFSPVVLVRLSRESQARTDCRTWFRLMKLTAYWSGLWASLGMVSLMLWGNTLLSLSMQLSPEQIQMALECCYYFLLGLPPLLLGAVCIRQLIVTRRHRWLVAMAVVSLVLNALTSYLLFLVMGTPGIALATSLVYVFTSLAMGVVVVRGAGGLIARP